MKILFNTAKFNHSPNNAQLINSIEIARRLSDEYEFSIFNFTSEEIDNIESIYLKDNFMGRLKKLFRLIFAKEKIIIYYYDGIADKIFVRLKKYLKKILISTLEVDYDRDSWNNERIENSLKYSNYIFTISERIQKEVRKYYPQKMILHTPVGYESEIFYPIKPYNERKYITYIGSMQKRKQPEVFIRISELFPNEEFLMIGEGVDEFRKNEIENIVTQKNIKNLTWFKQKNRYELAEILNNSKLFILPSLHEGTPKVLYEAAGCLVPCLTLKNIYSPVVINCFSGFVCEDENDLVNKAKMICDDKELANTFSRNLLSLSRKYSWENSAKEWRKALNMIKSNI